MVEAIDHTLLKPDCTKEDILKLCEEANAHGFSAVCVPPFYVKECFNYLEDKHPKIATVIGFPMGYSATPAKVEEIKRAIDEGADELDVVINLCAVKSKNWAFLGNDIDSVTRATHLRGKVVKIILETSLLEKEELDKLCDICSKVGTDFVKTSTGFHKNSKPVDVEMIKYLRKILPDEIKIKASGGIRTLKDAKELLEAGADRLGTSSAIKIMAQNS